jgi:hypothetical protein
VKEHYKELVKRTLGKILPSFNNTEDDILMKILEA